MGLKALVSENISVNGVNIGRFNALDFIAGSNITITSALEGSSALGITIASTGSGTVTSVGLAAPPEFTVSGSPVVGAGTLTFSKANQNANLVYAGPSSGGAAAPTFRAIVSADLPADVAYTDAANSFTVSPQTITADADAHKGLIVKAHSATQSANLLEIGSASGMNVLTSAGTGTVTIGNALNTGSSSTTCGGLVLGPGANSNNPLLTLVADNSIGTWSMNYDAAGNINWGKLNSGSVGSFTFYVGGWSVVNADGTKNFFSYDRSTATFIIYENDGSASAVNESLILNSGNNNPNTGFGLSAIWKFKSSTTNNRLVAEIDGIWADNTDATRKGRLLLGAHDASTSSGSPREGMRIESSGSAAKIGFLGTSAVAQQSGNILTALSNYGLVTSPALPSDVVYNDVTTTLSAGYNVTSYSGGTISSGTYTPAVGNAKNNQQYITNGGAFTLGVPASDGTWIVLITNNGSAGSITTSSYTKVTGDSFDTTNTHKFMCFISVVNVISLLNVVAMQ